MRVYVIRRIDIEKIFNTVRADKWCYTIYNLNGAIRFRPVRTCYTALHMGEKSVRYYVNKCRNGIYNLNAVAIKNR